ncbi:MAG: hypothetical protein HRT73_08110 [Flavobacteriales bacterium]|nr:hypothetical protein [Flavobacteriales bacterium]NQX97828.1 hypothetical protein [Flavobacteriales bacterium]
MKKKNTLYIMVPIVVLVWGFVLFQLFGSFFSSPNYAKETIEKIVNIDEIKKDTFSIIANYRDPFLGKKVRNKGRGNSRSNTSANSRKRIPTQIKAEKPWPIVVYNGMIKNNNSDRRVGIVKVGGKEYLVKEKDVVAEVTILSINKNEVNVRFQKESKTITK